ncbi:hypothetical protein [Rouxiella chamberiensis]|uniref:Phage tail protein n=1 Tax=Rouxiella chamberiensis TaxID=1513468 RepID=A0ABY7HQ63_9GAMM|nr:hypothetical protein [Rouxiella chamberiensis]WAT01528.1 hypothetical protein O1V66_01745 [Rouxiella chamberiensis]
MAMGARLYINGTSFDVVNAFLPSYYLDIISGTVSGSKAQAVPTGKLMKAEIFALSMGGTGTAPSYSISGNVISWANLSSQYQLIVYAE